MWETWVQFLGWDIPLEKEMATHSCLENPMGKGAWQATVHGITRDRYNLVLFLLSYNKRKRLSSSVWHMGTEIYSWKEETICWVLHFNWGGWVAPKVP